MKNNINNENIVDNQRSFKIEMFTKLRNMF